MRRNWASRKSELLKNLNDGTYQFDTVKEHLIDGRIYEVWTAADAVEIEALTELFKERGVTDNCSSYHLKGKGGVKAAIGEVRKSRNEYEYVMKTDVKKYYASMVHETLYEILEKSVEEAPILRLLYQFMKRTICRDGLYRSIEKGICRGTSLFPMLGALYLEELDVGMGKNSSFYIRYMDDIIVMAKNKWSFRRFIRKVNRTFDKLNLSKAEDKTFIGKIEKGFDFLGFHFHMEGMTISKKSVRKFAENIVLKLDFCIATDIGKITPGTEAQCGNSSVYDTKQLTGKNLKGDLLIPETVSAYIFRWLKWVKSMYGEKINILLSAPPAPS